MEVGSGRAPGGKRAERRRKKQGGIEHPNGSGIWYAQFFCAGCTKHEVSADRMKRQHREKVGAYALAVKEALCQLSRVVATTATPLADVVGRCKPLLPGMLELAAVLAR